MAVQAPSRTTRPAMTMNTGGNKRIMGGGPSPSAALRSAGHTTSAREPSPKPRRKTPPAETFGPQPALQCNKSLPRPPVCRVSNSRLPDRAPPLTGLLGAGVLLCGLGLGFFALVVCVVGFLLVLRLS